MSSIFSLVPAPLRQAWRWGLVAGVATLLTACFGGDDDTPAPEKKGQQLSYDLYLPGTLTQWGHVSSNKFTFDATRGVYHIDNVRAGLVGGDGRQFKVTSAGWTHQFGFGPNDASTTTAQSTVTFTGDTSISQLAYFGDTKNLNLPLDSDATDPSGDVLLDFEVKVLEPGATPKVQLTIRKDLPPLTKTLSVSVAGATASTLVYRGDGAYTGGALLQSGANSIVVTDGNGRQYSGTVAAGQTSGDLAACAASCTASVNVTDTFHHEVKVVAPADGSTMKIVLRKLSFDEAKAVAPHFDADGPVLEQVYAPYAGQADGRSETVRVSVSDRAAPLRTFSFSSTQEQRDSGPSFRILKEDATRPVVKSGSLLFDGLFALAVDDGKLDSVAAISDGSYNDGNPIACDCFQTGEKWSYVWTRDLSYAADLGLAAFDPRRVVNSLLFKTSGLRDSVAAPSALPAGTVQIVQDTGSGGSWPVSTDRVSWALAAETVLNHLDDAGAAAFSDQAYAALRGTVEADRAAAFDAKAGLYGGEQSYLDWRTQTYAPWIVNNLSRMSSSKSLSTNVAHYRALRLVARLAAQKGDAAPAATYAAWAEQLKAAVNATFWLDDVKLYASLTTSGEDPAPVHKYDMLGTAQAVLSGIAPEDRAREALARYPHAPFGVPVYYPQQPNVFVYHNRSLWPFVTAYALKAAAQVRNPKVAANALDSLMRGAALHLSNMENLEWLTGKAAYDDGPAINSRRQLWSVGGYLGAVTETVFGYTVQSDGIRVQPFLTTAARRALGTGATASIENLAYKGRPVKVVLRLPAVVAGDGYYPVASVKLNGTDVAGPVSTAQMAAGANTFEVSFGAVTAGDARITLAAQVDSKSHTDPAVFSPEVPTLDAITASGGTLSIAFSDAKNGSAGQPVSYNVYRDGTLVQGGLKTFAWTDPAMLAAGRRYCYAVEAVFNGSLNRSHHSEPACYEAGAVQTVAVSDARVSSNVVVSAPTDGIAQPTLHLWGKPADSLALSSVSVAQAGAYGIELAYNNHQADISTGVTNAVKLLRVLDASGAEVAHGVVQMPNVEGRNGGNPVRTSTMVRVDLPAGTYRLELLDFFNMSYLTSNATYGGSGGKGGPVNTASIAAVRIVSLGQ